MNPLESRKQMLIAESELHRLQLLEGLAALKADGRAVSPDTTEKPSRRPLMVKGARLLSAAWWALRSRRRA